MTFELWDLVSRNLIDWFESQSEAAEAVQAYVDAGDAKNVVLIENAGNGETERSLTGADLSVWLAVSGGGRGASSQSLNHAPGSPPSKAAPSEQSGTPPAAPPRQV
jgi:hypothetical protein